MLRPTAPITPVVPTAPTISVCRRVPGMGQNHSHSKAFQALRDVYRGHRSIQLEQLGLEVSALRQPGMDRVVGGGAAGAQDAPAAARVFEAASHRF
jgi:hypothetical protein